MGRKYGFSFSWKRATGVAGLKNKISRKIGVPLTRSGRRQKVGNISGCLLPLLAILCFVTAFAPSQSLNSPEWKLIKEMSGPIPQQDGFTVKTYGAKIARAGDVIKISLRFDFPEGLPAKAIPEATFPKGFDISSITRIEGRITLDCENLVVKPLGNTADVYQFNGKKLKSREPLFKIGEANLFARYFCERSSPPPKLPPQLKTPNP